MPDKMPLPQSINYLWNFSSLISLVYSVQLISSILLSLRYFASVGTSPFTSVEVIMREVDLSFMVRSMHLVSSQAMLLLIYSHMLRSLYYGRSANIPMSLQSAVILLITMSAAFLSYVLPWSQMSFWGATVITSFLSVLPYSQDILEWVWSGFTVSHPTLTRFFSLHYLLSLVIAPLSLMHILILHMQSSSSPMGDRTDYYIPFWPYFSVKDSWPAAFVFCVMLTMTLFLMPETENLKNANPMVTPTHIKPEWYFLMFYAILRAVPSKVSSLVLMLLSIVALIALLVSSKNLSMTPLSNFMCSTFLVICLLLSVLSSKPVEEPFLTVSSLLSLTYFSMAFSIVTV